MPKKRQKAKDTGRNEFVRKMAKQTSPTDKPIAVLTIKGIPGMDKSQLKAISYWLEKISDFIQTRNDEISQNFRARYMG